MSRPDLSLRLAELRVNNPALRLHALVDGLLYQECQQDVPLLGEPGTMAVLAGTIDDHLFDAGPWVIDYELAPPPLRTAVLYAEKSMPTAVTWIIAPLDIEALAEMLRARIDVSLPDGRTAMLRFWDPRTLAVIGRDLDASQRHEFFGEIVEWHFALDGRHVHIARRHADAH